MKYIDMESWPRRKHFEVFNGFDYPHFNVCADVEVTELQAAFKGVSASFTLGLTYALARAANSIPEFRYRIREGRVIEYDVIHPSITILLENETFSFCTLKYVDDFPEFIKDSEKRFSRCSASSADKCRFVSTISMATCLPTARVRRCVPPAPGITPSSISGWPNLADSEAMIMSHAMASSFPPPRHHPDTAAMTGFWSEATKSHL